MMAGETSTELLERAEALLGSRNLLGALAAFNRAERSGADADRCAGGRWMAHMYAGNFQSAWAQSDVIRARGARDSHRFWDGQAIDGKRLILRCLHGLGDAVQMLRFMPQLQECCANVTLQVPPALLPLATSFSGVREVITWGANARNKEPPWDTQVEVMELPYLLRVSKSDVKVTGKYLELSGRGCGSVRERVGCGVHPRVGLVWSASEWDPTRCIPMDCVGKITSTPGIEFWNLQGEPAHSRASQDAALAGVIDAAEFGRGLLPLACCIQHMDLILSVDTLAAHLAGAMGKTAWILLQHRADWRWMHERSDSPWYPTLRLWRQPMQGHWASLTDAVCEELLLWRENWVAI